MNPGGITSVNLTLRRAVIAAVLVATGSLVLQGAVSALKWTINKPPMPLRQELPTIARRLGPYEGPVDRLMDHASLESLGTKDYLLREYHDTRLAGANTPGASLMLNINYYAVGSSSPHVPDVCWQGSGRERHPTLGEREFLLKDVHHLDGSVSDVKLRMLSFLPTKAEWTNRPEGVEDDAKYLRNVVYTFNVNGTYVANRREVESLFWKPGNKHAYHMKIEVTLPTNCSPDVARPQLEEFMRAILPEVEKCLPDPKAEETDGSATRPADKVETSSSATSR